MAHDLPALLNMARAFYDEDGFATTDADLRNIFGILLQSNRGIGVGSALICDAMLRARSQAATQLQVVVAPNARDVNSLLDFYRSRGFLDEGRRLLMHDLS